jgi:hypothetical protein
MLIPKPIAPNGLAVHDYLRVWRGLQKPIFEVEALVGWVIRLENRLMLIPKPIAPTGLAAVQSLVLYLTREVRVRCCCTLAHIRFLKAIFVNRTMEEPDTHRETLPTPSSIFGVVVVGPRSHRHLSKDYVAIVRAAFPCDSNDYLRSSIFEVHTLVGWESYQKTLLVLRPISAPLVARSQIHRLAAAACSSARYKIETRQ